MIAVNRPATGELASAMADLFVEVVIAPDYEDEARSTFAAMTFRRISSAAIGWW